ncbi:hypothetical protein [Botrimarina mediterranea]|uniref:Uncharacterized protein n=1 Tax=Botrimarina mediterranea TaxID=2528022 RepID=A0A518K793_9BACT|nr:hypothetical protein [Botrimarina mediterranea]QDV73654.1 hypothetical protein Spa11_18530 [Botrimarina mediterranea]QDV78244.1 hypothetical protein K2D_18510 [Planctomycetes bacterium K2D]
MPPETRQTIETLARHSRVLTVRQIAKAFFGTRRDPLDCARRGVRTLVRHKLAVADSLSLGVVAVEGPLCRYRPGDMKPNLAAVSWRNQQRWRAALARQAVCVRATENGLATFGGACRPPRPRELEHDASVGAVYLRLLAEGRADAWRHEDAFPPQAGERPDATYEREGETVTVEVLGRGYTRQKIESVWRAYREGPLELW